MMYWEHSLRCILQWGLDIDLSQNRPKKSKEWSTIATTQTQIFGNESWEQKSYWRFLKNPNSCKWFKEKNRIRRKKIIFFPKFFTKQYRNNFSPNRLFWKTVINQKKQRPISTWYSHFLFLFSTYHIFTICELPIKTKKVWTESTFAFNSICDCFGDDGHTILCEKE